MRTLLTNLLVALSAMVFAQDPADIFHTTVDLDEINRVTFQVYDKDQVEYKTWPGDDILIETSVKLNNAESRILDFYLGQNRYDLEPNVEGDQLSLVSTDMKRYVVKGTENVSSETVVIVVYMPEEFEAAGENQYARVSR